MKKTCYAMYMTQNFYDKCIDSVIQGQNWIVTRWFNDGKLWWNGGSGGNCGLKHWSLAMVYGEGTHHSKYCRQRMSLLGVMCMV